MIKLKNNLSKTDRNQFWDNIIYSEQFKDSYKTIFHIYNTCYLFVSGDKDKLKRIVTRYNQDIKEDVVQKQFDKISKKHNPEHATAFRFDCFSHIDQLLTEEDYYFIQVSKHRFVTLKEFKFLLQRITKNIYKSDNCSSVLTNKYFLESGLQVDYEKYTGKAISSHKLAYILQVMQKYNYLHIRYNTKNQRVVQIGLENPYYLLHGVPDVEEQAVATLTDRKFSHLVSENMMLQTVVELLREELAEANTQADTLGEQVESLQQENASMMNLLCEKDEELKQFKTVPDYVPDYKVEGSWVTYNLEGYGPVQLSLN